MALSTLSVIPHNNNLTGKLSWELSAPAPAPVPQVRFVRAVSPACGFYVQNSQRETLGYRAAR